MSKSITEIKILSKIGEGGFGEIYEALILNSDGFRKKVIAKKIKSELSKNTLDEAKIQASLKHPNICEILDIKSLDGNEYILLEFIDGRTLSDLILDHKTKNTEFLISDIKKYLFEISSALDFLHKNGIIHRDVNPSNIIVDKFNNIKIIDFGLSVEISEDSKNDYTKTLTGTFSYLSPERILGNNQAKESDFFALGIILQELLTLENPFKKNNDFLTLEAIKNASFEREILKTYEKNKIQEIVNGLLNPNLGKRYNHNDVKYFLKHDNLLIAKKLAIFFGIILFIAAGSYFFFSQVRIDDATPAKVTLLSNGQQKEILLSRYPAEKQMDSIQCYMFYRSFLAYPDLLFKKEQRDSFYSAYKNKDQLIGDVIKVMNTISKNGEPVFDKCSKVKNNSQVREFYNLILSHLISIYEKKGSLLDIYVPGFGEKEVQLAIGNLLIPENVAANDLMASILKIASKISISAKYFPNQHSEIVNDLIPFKLDLNFCKYLSFYAWSEAIGNNLAGLKSDGAVRYVIYNSSDYIIKENNFANLIIERKGSASNIETKANICITEINGTTWTKTSIYRGD